MADKVINNSSDISSGREKFNLFSNQSVTSPIFLPSSSGPKDSDLVQVAAVDYSIETTNEAPTIELTKPDSIRQYLDDTVLPVLKDGLRKLVKQRC